MQGMLDHEDDYFLNKTFLFFAAFVVRATGLTDGAGVMLGYSIGLMLRNAIRGCDTSHTQKRGCFYDTLKYLTKF